VVLSWVIISPNLVSDKLAAVFDITGRNKLTVLREADHSAGLCTFPRGV
jgi:hypothetical protein